MKALSIIENDDGRIIITYTPAEPDTPEVIRLLHSAMAMVVSIHTDRSE